MKLINVITERIRLAKIKITNGGNEVSFIAINPKTERKSTFIDNRVADTKITFLGLKPDTEKGKKISEDYKLAKADIEWKRKVNEDGKRGNAFSKTLQEDAICRARSLDDLYFSHYNKKRRFHCRRKALTP